LIFDVRDPLHPKIAASFTDMAGYMHPHSFLRLPNGNVLATFQHVHRAGPEGQIGKTGGFSTNSSMHDEDIFSGVTYQVWRLSDLKLLKTSFFDVGDDRYASSQSEIGRMAGRERQNRMERFSRAK
jgi:hypothetical protein